MEIFSIVCLVVIMFIIQHLLNWFWRRNYKDEGLLVLGLFLTVVGYLISGVCIYHIISWGKCLI